MKRRINWKLLENNTPYIVPRFIAVEKWDNKAVIQATKADVANDVLEFCTKQYGGAWMLGLWQMAVTHRGKRYNFTQSNPIELLNNYFYLVIRS